MAGSTMIASDLQQLIDEHALLVHEEEATASALRSVRYRRGKKGKKVRVLAEQQLVSDELLSQAMAKALADAENPPPPPEPEPLPVCWRCRGTGETIFTHPYDAPPPCDICEGKGVAPPLPPAPEEKDEPFDPEEWTWG